MPPRYVYWTIIVDGQPTAFRSGSLEDIMPTFNRLKEKQPSAELKWFQNGQLWPSRHDAQDFMRARGERGRAKDPRQSKGEETEVRSWNAKPEWKTRSTFSPRPSSPKPPTSAKATADRQAPSRDSAERPAWVPKGAAPKKDKDVATSWGEGEDRPAGQARSDRKPEWKPKGTFKPKEAGHASGWGEKPAFAKASAGQARGGGSKPAWTSKGDKPEWKPKSSSSPKPAGDGVASGFSRSREEKPAWKPKGTFKPKEEGHRPSARDQARSSFRPKSFTPKVDDGRTRASRVQSRNDKLEWTPKGSAPRPDGPNAGFAKSDPDAPKRKWVPKAEYKKSLGIEAKRDDKWRPGGEHKDPKQKYKDAKKAKWTKFKANIRARSTKPRKSKDE